MNGHTIDIPKSKQAGRLIFDQMASEKIAYFFLYATIVIALPFIGIMELKSDFSKNHPIGFSLLLLIVSLIFSATLIYAIFNLNSLKRIKGLSRNQNSNLIKKIIERQNWNVYSTNQQMTRINFSANYNSAVIVKQITILYDENDILVNCTSFGVFSVPSPFHLFANRRKVNKFETEFENEIKNCNKLHQSSSIDEILTNET